MSICRFKKNKKGNSIIEKNFRILNKKIIFEKDFWSLQGSHDGYRKKYGIIHDREIQFYPEANKIIGKDKIINDKKFKKCNFEVRFHLLPETKITKTQDGKAILIELENSGWRFSCNNYLIDVETGLYFGRKNSYTENQNILISGTVQNEGQDITWEIKKI